MVVYLQEGDLLDDNKSVVQTVNYGKVIINIHDILVRKGIKRNNLAVRSQISYSVIDRLFKKGDEIERIDADVIARICYVLDCDISDIIFYRRP